MRIAVVHSFYSSASPSGENSVVLAQTDALRRAGHDVELFAKSTDSESKATFYKVRSALRAANVSGPTPAAGIHRFQPDIVHTHNLFPNWSSKWMTRWSDRLVATLHNYRTVCSSGILWRDGHDCEDCLHHGSLSAVRHKCYRGSAVATLPLAFSSRSSGAHQPLLRYPHTLIVLNSRAKEIFSRVAVGPRVELVPNFAAAQKAEPGRPGSNWIYVGRLTGEKGVTWLLENWPRTSVLDIVGTGPLQEEVQQAASREPGRLRYHGQLSHDEVRARIGAARGLILPSLWSEGIPTVALEALQAGTPVVISDRCSSSVELTGAASGRIFTVDADGSSLEAALEQVSQAGPGMRTAAKRLYAENFGEPSWISRMEAIYAGVVHTGGGTC